MTIDTGASCRTVISDVTPRSKLKPELYVNKCDSENLRSGSRRSLS